jgi:hypothetical protein
MIFFGNSVSTVLYLLIVGLVCVEYYCKGDEVEAGGTSGECLTRGLVQVYINWLYLIFLYLFPFTLLAVFNILIYSEVRRANTIRASLSRSLWGSCCDVTMYESLVISGAWGEGGGWSATTGAMPPIVQYGRDALCLVTSRVGGRGGRKKLPLVLLSKKLPFRSNITRLCSLEDS